MSSLAVETRSDAGPTHFEIQHYTVLEGWINTWYAQEGIPTYFSSIAAAEDELREFFLELEDEVEAGAIEPYNEAEFRIVSIRLM
jgi:hypothetical protein